MQWIQSMHIIRLQKPIVLKHVHKLFKYIIDMFKAFLLILCKQNWLIMSSAINVWISLRNAILMNFGATVHNKKTHPPCYSPFRFSRISPEPLELPKIYWRLFASFSEALSAGTRIFNIRWQNQLIHAKTLICQ